VLNSFLCDLTFAQYRYNNKQNSIPNFITTPTDSSEVINREGIYWGRATISGISLLSLNVLTWSYYVNTWYDKTSNTFQFRDDWYDHSLNVDKLGHYWTATVLHKTVYKLCQWSNFSQTESLILSSTLAWLQMFPIEIKDGYYVTYGFAWSDLMANTLGAVYPSLQVVYPSLQAFNIKMSMSVSPNYKQYYQIKNPIDDYEARTFWLSVDVHKLLPKTWKNYWPSWLCLAVGYGGSEMFRPDGGWNIDKNRQGLGRQEWYLALDYNLMEIFKPEKNTFLYQFFDFLNMLHLPAPTIRFTPTTVFYGLYF